MKWDTKQFRWRSDEFGLGRVLLILQLNTLMVKTAFFCSSSCLCSPRHHAGELRAPANLSRPYVSSLACGIFSLVLHTVSSVSELSSLPQPHAVSPQPLSPHTDLRPAMPVNSHIELPRARHYMKFFRSIKSFNSSTTLRGR